MGLSSKRMPVVMVVLLSLEFRTFRKAVCHPERSEGSRQYREILRFAQDDSCCSLLISLQQFRDSKADHGGFVEYEADVGGDT